MTTCGTGYTRSTDSCTRNGTTYYKECIANTCDSGYNQTTTCTAGYDQETCQAGTTTKYKCTPKACTGFDKLASDTCPTGFHKSETTCLSGTTTKYKCVADVCDASAYQSAACGAGYDQETCQAGTTTMYKCTPKACTGFDKLASDTCPTGFHKSETTCLSGTTTKYKCIANTCDSSYNQTTTCAAGYDQETCQAGTTTMYKCTPKACTGFDKLASDTCPTGFHKSETTCLSGTTTKYKCIANTCDSSYNQTTTCAAGYDQETCQAGDTTMYKCTLCTFTTPVTDCNSSNGLVPSDRICTKNGVKYTDQCDYYSLNLGYMCNSNAQCFDGNRYSRVRSDDIDSNTNTPRSTSFCESGQYQGWKCNSVLGNYEWYLDPTKPFKEHIELINFVRYQARYLLTDMKDHQQHYCKMDGTPGGSSESELLLAICVPVISIDPI